MRTLIKHGPYVAEIAPDETGFAGQVVNVSDFISFEAATLESVPGELAQALREHEEFCERTGSHLEDKILSEPEARQHRRALAQEMLASSHPEAGIEALEYLIESPDEELAQWARTRLEEIRSSRES